uniref:NADH-ubiquinone oxidoreductase chain 2 n=1 Tax=Tropiocolotes tripolitanus TaxID=930273 RepID=A0A0A1HAL2_9SAUR|nr:NADH dehydrogenase subunit 2 [Tropiocolotes tripolitanus]
MNPLIWALLITSISTSTIITMSSSHWLLAWLGLELNTLSILPIIMKPGHPRATEATTKYFLIQTTAAALILCATTMNAWKTGQWTISYTPTPAATTLLTIAIAMKLGLAPTHLWYPEVMQGSTTGTALIISTWQKIAPLSLLMMTHNNLNTNLLLALGLASAAIGSWGGLNQTQTRKIMAFSSIAHMGWLITALALNQALTTLTMIIYITMTSTIFNFLATTMTKTISDTGMTWPISPPLTTTTMLALVSLAGLPPLTGFMPKWLILKELSTLPLISLLLLMTSLPSLFFYTRLAYFMTITTPPTTTNTEYKWRFNTNIKPNTTLIMTSALLLLPLTPLLYNTT